MLPTGARIEGFKALLVSGTLDYIACFQSSAACETITMANWITDNRVDAVSFSNLIDFDCTRSEEIDSAVIVMPS